MPPYSGSNSIRCESATSSTSLRSRSTMAAPNSPAPSSARVVASEACSATFSISAFLSRYASCTVFRIVMKPATFSSSMVRSSRGQ